MKNSIVKDAEAQAEEGHVRTHAEAEVNAASHPGMPYVVRSLQKPGERFVANYPSEPLEGIRWTDILILKFWPPKFRKNTFLLF